MAAEIDMSNERANIAFVGEKPWHGLGTELTKDSPIEVWEKEAGFNWTAKESTITVKTDDGSKLFTGRKAIYRSDTNEPLSIVGENYKIVQPKEVLEFFRDSLSQGMYLETAGMLFGGRRFWALANTGEQFQVLGKDTVKGYLLLSTSIDGALASSAQFTSVRVVCNNTIQIALNQSVKASERVRVTHRQNFDPLKIKAQLGIMDSSWVNFKQKVEALSKVKLSDNDAFENFKRIIVGEDVGKEISNANMRNIAELDKLYKTGMGSQYAYGTAWGQLNAFTEMIDHHRGRIPSNQFDFAQFGGGAKEKVKVMDMFVSKYAGDLLAA